MKQALDPLGPHKMQKARLKMRRAVRGHWDVRIVDGSLVWPFPQQTVTDLGTVQFARKRRKRYAKDLTLLGGPHVRC